MSDTALFYNSMPRFYYITAIFLIFLSSSGLAEPSSVAIHDAFQTKTQPKNILPSIFKSPFSIGAQFYDYQNYHGIPYFHGGMDICAPAGTDVIAPISGLVRVSTYKIDAGAKPHRFSYLRKNFRLSDTSQTRYLEVSIKDEYANLWMFRHIDPKSVPSEVFKLAEKNIPIPVGTKIGEIAPWHLPIKPEPGNYHHIHLEILASDTSYLNPADFVSTGKDYYRPAIKGIFFLKHNSEEGFSGNPHPVVKGKIDLIAMVNDRMNSSSYKHSVYSASWKLEQIMDDNSLMPAIAKVNSYRFDRLPIKGERIQLSKVIFRDRMDLGGKKVLANGNNGPRIFLLNLTAGNVKGGYDSYNCLDTRSLVNGLYRCTIKICDRAGNEKKASQDFHISNEASMR